MTPRSDDTHPLLVGMNVRTSMAQREFLETVAGDHDLTLSGAVRWCIDQAMAAPIDGGASWDERRAAQATADELDDAESPSQ